MDEFKVLLSEVSLSQPFLSNEDHEDIVSFILSEKWMGTSKTTDELIKQWKRENKDYDLEKAKSFTAINEEGTSEEWLLNHKSIEDFENQSEYADEDRIKPSQDLEVFLECLGVKEEVKKWVINSYRMNLNLMTKLSLRSEKKQFRLLTKTITSKIL